MFLLVYLLDICKTTFFLRHVIIPWKHITRKHSNLDVNMLSSNVFLVFIAWRQMKFSGMISKSNFMNASQTLFSSLASMVSKSWIMLSKYRKLCVFKEHICIWFFLPFDLRLKSVLNFLFPSTYAFQVLLCQEKQSYAHLVCS